MVFSRPLRSTVLKLLISFLVIFAISGYLSPKTYLKRSCLFSKPETDILKPVDYESLHEGDVVLFLDSRQGKRQLYGPTRFLAAVTHNKKLQQLYRRTDGDSGAVELYLYGDDDEEPIDVKDPSISLTELVDGFQYTQRIVEDRVSNPHGEHAEDVWILSDVTAIQSIIGVNDIYIRMGPFQH